MTTDLMNCQYECMRERERDREGGGREEGREGEMQCRIVIFVI